MHHWLVTYRGGEKVMESLCRLMPDADLFTLVHDPAELPPILQQRAVQTSFLQHIPRSTRIYPSLLPLMPLAAEQFDLRDYDLVLTSDASVVKGVLTRSDQLHVCYCYSPPRYAWDLAQEYLAGVGRAKRLAARLSMHYVRMADLRGAQGVDAFIAISHAVAARIRKHYRRESAVIYPPVDVDRFRVADDVGEHYLVAGQLVGYKRPDLAVEAFAALGKPLRVAGDGPLLESLKKRAPANVTFLGRVDDATLERELATCRALVFPGEEDFGIVPVEAMACGRPVIALGRGGALETVVGPVLADTVPTDAQLDGATGLFFDREDPGALCRAVEVFEQVREAFTPAACRARAVRFDEPRFRDEVAAHLESLLASPCP